MNIHSTLDLFAGGDNIETGFVTQLRDKITMYIDQDTGEIQPPDAKPTKVKPESKKHKVKKVKAGGPGSGRVTWNPYDEQAIHRASKPFGHAHDPSVEPSNRRSLKEAQENEEWHKGLEEMGIHEGILDAEEEQVEMESGPISRKLGKKIKKIGTNFCVLGQEPDVNLGCYNSMEQAESVKRGGSFIEPELKAVSGMPTTGWQYGKRTLPVGYIPQRTLSGFPSGKGGGRGGLPKTPTHGTPNPTPTPKPHSMPHAKVASPVKPVGGTGHHLPNKSMSHGTGSGHRMPNPSMKSYADMGEPMAGALGHAHIDSRLWFTPPSLAKRGKGNYIPTDDPGEKDDKYLDVTKRNSKDTKEQRMKLLKRSAPGGSPPLIPAHTTLVSPHQATYLPGMFGQAVRTRPVLAGRARLVSKSY